MQKLFHFYERAFFFREALNDLELVATRQGRLKGRAERGNKLAGI
jgi:hypothetical protein